MRFAALLGLFGVLAGGALATCDASCPKYNIATCAVDAAKACLAPPVPLKTKRSLPSLGSNLLRRTCGACPPAECPAEYKKCTPGGQKPPQLPPTSVYFDCGQHPTQSFVSVTYENCPAPYDPSKKCLVLKLSDPALEPPKLEISSKPLTSSTPGKFSYFKPTNYCTATSCVVPIDVVLAREGLTNGALCGLNLWIGLHSGLRGETCWPQGSEINDGNGNWAQEFSIKFECPVADAVCCCCPPAQPDKKCGSETAYASQAGNTFNLPGLGCTNAWGYYQKYDAAFVNGLPVGGLVYTASLLAGQTNPVGDVTVTKLSSECFSVTLDAAAKRGIGKTHIDISCSDPKTNLDKFCRTPGKYEFNSGCFDVDPYTTPMGICVESPCAGPYYFIVHSETYSVVSYDAGNPGGYDNCTPYVCAP